MFSVRDKVKIDFPVCSVFFNSLLVYAVPWSATIVYMSPCSGITWFSIALSNSLVVAALTGMTIGHLVSWSTKTKKYLYLCLPVAVPSFPEKSEATVRKGMSLTGLFGIGYDPLGALLDWHDSHALRCLET